MKFIVRVRDESGIIDQVLTMAGAKHQYKGLWSDLYPEHVTIIEQEEIVK